MMRTDCDFYICPTCFAVSERLDDGHEHDMIHCGKLNPGDRLLSPLMDSSGDVISRAPRWFLEKVEKRWASDDPSSPSPSAA